ncbi:flagella synthesis protein FlgN [Gilvimarinus polysaccharolyticus]|uniref:flagella synthesis protein FlgN n=1 Tax=Gilvimarinus polysaccharolyticus TaxID=863921 RepID=UPI000673C48E|nr:flagellar protein FlgN [Gilvimarinus polysaccharolyticus]
MSANPQLVREMLNRDLHAAQRLQELLIEERGLLQTRNHEALVTLISEKNSHLTLLEGHAKERAALLQALQLDDNPQSWQEFLASDAHLTELIPLWQQLHNEVSQCNELNNLNGKLVARSQQTLKRLLDLVRGKTSTAGLYDASGSATNSSSSNTLTRA